MEDESPIGNGFSNPIGGRFIHGRRWVHGNLGDGLPQQLLFAIADRFHSRFVHVQDTALAGVVQKDHFVGSVENLPIVALAVLQLFMAFLQDAGGLRDFALKLHIP